LKNSASFNAEVHSNTVIQGRHHRLELDLDNKGSGLFRRLEPGQFAEFDLCNVSLPRPENIPEHLADVSQRHILLRRPFSFSSVRELDTGTIRVELLYCVVGPATLRMTTLAKGDQLRILGPLGNGFSVPDGKTNAILVIGGMGAPPLLHLSGYLQSTYPEVKPVAFVGAKTTSDLPFTLRSDNKGHVILSEFERLGVPCHLATDDGSGGFAGFVTKCLQEWLKSIDFVSEKAIIYGCGPEAMLAELAKLAAKYKIDCQVSMERMMGCGTGLCQSCAVRVQNGAKDETEYTLCCKDGPVFDSRDVIFRCQD
jgi:dihydroorotate dehydrogenase electron transfer subunit